MQVFCKFKRNKLFLNHKLYEQEVYEGVMFAQKLDLVVQKEVN